MSDLIQCPECGSDYGHIRKVHTLLGTDPIEAGPAYVGTEIGGATNARRNALEVIIDGECGHVFSFIIQQHKGNLFVSTETKR